MDGKSKSILILNCMMEDTLASVYQFSWHVHKGYVKVITNNHFCEVIIIEMKEHNTVTMVLTRSTFWTNLKK